MFLTATYFPKNHPITIIIRIPSDVIAKRAYRFFFFSISPPNMYSPLTLYVYAEARRMAPTITDIPITNTVEVIIILKPPEDSSPKAEVLPPADTTKLS